MVVQEACMELFVKDLWRYVIGEGNISNVQKMISSILNVIVLK